MDVMYLFYSLSVVVVLIAVFVVVDMSRMVSKERATVEEMKLEIEGLKMHMYSIYNLYNVPSDRRFMGYRK